MCLGSALTRLWVEYLHSSQPYSHAGLALWKCFSVLLMLLTSPTLLVAVLVFSPMFFLCSMMPKAHKPTQENRIQPLLQDYNGLVFVALLGMGLIASPFLRSYQLYNSLNRS